ncbi:MAG: hypothetical protein AAF570_09805, partial [Bacteroidota bacterium]
SGMSQVVLCRFGTKRKAAGEKLEVTARLVYARAKDRKLIREEASEKLPVRLTISNDLTDSEVRKNHTIADMAVSYRKMAADYEQGKETAAQQSLQAAIDRTLVKYPAREDEDVVRVLEILEAYVKQMETIAQANREREAE